MNSITVEIELPNVKLECFYDSSRKIVSVIDRYNWSRNSEIEFNLKQSEIFDYKLEDDLFSLNCWTDSSPYIFWKDKHKNYLAVIVHLNKSYELLTEKEINIITEAVITAFNKLN
jgi:hypothetical protein